MAQGGSMSPSDERKITPELSSISSPETEPPSEDATLESSPDSTGSSADGSSCTYDLPSSSSDQATSSSHNSRSIEKVIAEIQRKLTEKSEVRYNVLLVAADDEHHIRSVCDIGQMLQKAGHYVTLAHLATRKIFALEYELDFMEIENAVDSVLSYRATNWIHENLEKFHGQPERLWADWDDNDKRELSRLVYEFTVTNRLIEQKLERLHKDFHLVIGNLETRYPFTLYGLPYIPVVYMNPLSLYTCGPPPFSGYPTDGNPAQARQYRRAQRDICDFFVKNLNRWWRSLGIPLLDNSSWWIDEPKKLGIYRYPEKLDYTNIGPKISDKWFRIDPDCGKFETTKAFELPEPMQFSPGKKIYINLGNLGVMKSGWRERFIALLEPIPHSFIYATGERQLETPSNVWTSQFIEDAEIIPKVDLVITHGVTDSLMKIIYHKKPVIIIPFLFDQYDNAQRVVECGIGRRLETTNISTSTISETIQAVLDDHSIPLKLAEISEQMKISDTRLKLRDKIEEICREYRERLERTKRVLRSNRG